MAHVLGRPARTIATDGRVSFVAGQIAGARAGRMQTCMRYTVPLRLCRYIVPFHVPTRTLA